MAREVDDDRLLKAGLEGFSSLEERRKKRPPQKTQIKSDPNINQQLPVPTINSKEAVQRYGGKVIEPVITSDKAALRYGGIVIGPPITSDKALQRYGGVLIK